MDKVNYEREKLGKKKVRPFQIFDLIGGTSTGGISAILLGRLQMDVQQCIDVYTDLFEDIFSDTTWSLKEAGSIKRPYSADALRECINKAIQNQDHRPNDSFLVDVPTCRV